MDYRDPRGRPSPAEEARLIAEAQAGGPYALDARNDLITRNFGLISACARESARKYRRPDLLEDFQTSGVFGMITAIRDFDPSREASLGTFARPRILAQQQATFEADQLVHLPGWLTGGKKRIDRFEPKHPGGRKLRDRCLARASQARAPIARLGERPGPGSYGEDLEDRGSAEPWEVAAGREELGRLVRALDQLNPSLRDVLLRRHGFGGRPESYASIGERYEMSKEWATKLEARALRSLVAILRQLDRADRLAAS